MYCILPIKQVYKIKNTTRNADGKQEVKYEEKEVTSYSHSSWLEDKNQDQIVKIQQQQCYWTRFSGVTFTIASWLAFKHVPVLHNLGWKVRVGATIGSGILAYAIAGYSLGVKNKALINKIISQNDLIPTWNDKSRVVQKSNVYFFLDDDKGFAPNVLYHGISEKQIDHSFPDGRFGNSKYINTYNSKFNSLIQNKDNNKTNQLLEDLSITPRAKRVGGAHH